MCGPFATRPARVHTLPVPIYTVSSSACSPKDVNMTSYHLSSELTNVHERPDSLVDNFQRHWWTDQS